MRRLFVPALAALLFAHSPALRADELPEDAARLVAAFDEDSEAIRLEAERKIAIERRELAKKLKELQDKYTKAAMLDEAVAIRDKIRSLSDSTMPAQADPGTMSNFANRIGEKFYFRVTGANGGSIYGTGVYTYDSSIASAAVHSGVLKIGETAVLKVSMLPGRNNYLSTTANGITSSSWGQYSASFQVERVREALLPDEKVPNALPGKTIPGLPGSGPPVLRDPAKPDVKIEGDGKRAEPDVNVPKKPDEPRPETPRSETPKR